MFWKLLLPAAIAICMGGCASGTPNRAPLHNGPLFRTNWTPAFAHTSTTPASSYSSQDHTPGGPSARDIRRAVLSKSQELSDQAAEANDFGAKDLAFVLNGAGVKTSWKSSDGIPALVQTARKCEAFNTGKRPSPGDLVLFHLRLSSLAPVPPVISRWRCR